MEITGRIRSSGLIAVASALCCALAACGGGGSVAESVSPAASTAPTDSVTAEASAPASPTTSEPASAESTVEPSADAPGAYITLADYEADRAKYDDGDVVLFFNAQWCSTCKVARDNITAAPAAIPSGLTIVTVDFDEATELKQRYGVTLQHTFVQIDAEGTELAKWSGSTTAEEIAENTV
jgi:thiol-disulfide isomerase/thioredoxin